MPRAYSLQSSRFPLFPPVNICLRTGLLGIAGRDQRGLSRNRPDSRHERSTGKRIASLDSRQQDPLLAKVVCLILAYSRALALVSSRCPWRK